LDATIESLRFATAMIMRQTKEMDKRKWERPRIPFERLTFPGPEGKVGYHYPEGLLRRHLRVLTSIRSRDYPLGARGGIDSELFGLWPII
jgi:hypothetical protein